MKIKENIKLLRITLFAGLIFIFITGFGIFVYYTFTKGAAKTTHQQDNFFSILRDYDNTLKEFYGTEREYDHLNHILDRLENNAISVESWLSILKRRRHLSRNHSISHANYQKSIEKALAIYPYSQPIAAIAAGALIKDSAVNLQNKGRIRELLPVINDHQFNTISLGLHVLLGDFENPKIAFNSIPERISTNIISDGTDAIAINLAILKIMHGNFREAASDIQVLISNDNLSQWTDHEQTAQITPSEEALKLAGEFHFDFGDLLRSAEIFSRISDDYWKARQADALYLAGYKESALSIWNLMADVQSESSLYNLAIHALETNDLQQATQYLGKLYNLETISNKNIHQFGLIWYSRLLEYQQAIVTLQTNRNFIPADYPYIDLEICRRNAQIWNLDRRISENWLLLDRHHNNEDLYRWSSWHFYFQRRFDEIPILLNRLKNQNFSESWVNFYNALAQMAEGNLQAAESILLSIPNDEADWTVHANLGRIYDEIRSPSRALVQYEEALIKLQIKTPQNKQTIALIQQKIAKSLVSLGRQSEAMRVLLYAAELDPDNLTIRLELERLIH